MSKLNPSLNQIAIITNQPVMPSFDGTMCYLHAVIEEVKRHKLYKVRTDLVRYVDVVEYRENENGEVVEVTLEKLEYVETRQDWSRQEITEAQINKFTKIVTPRLPDDMAPTEFEKSKIQLMFLIERKQNAPWLLDPELWRLRKTEDLIRNKAI